MFDANLFLKKHSRNNNAIRTLKIIRFVRSLLQLYCKYILINNLSNIKIFKILHHQYILFIIINQRHWCSYMSNETGPPLKKHGYMIRLQRKLKPFQSWIEKRDTHWIRDTPNNRKEANTVCTTRRGKTGIQITSSRLKIDYYNFYNHYYATPL